jgi:hypothetical protein
MDTIVFYLIVWLVVGGILAVGVSSTGGNDGESAIAFFWPLTLPILLVFGAVWAVWTTVRSCIGWFKDDG